MEKIELNVVYLSKSGVYGWWILVICDSLLYVVLFMYIILCVEEIWGLVGLICVRFCGFMCCGVK